MTVRQAVLVALMRQADVVVKTGLRWFGAATGVLLALWAWGALA
jgi:hypothetical protein